MFTDEHHVESLILNVKQVRIHWSNAINGNILDSESELLIVGSFIEPYPCGFIPGNADMWLKRSTGDVNKDENGTPIFSQLETIDGYDDHPDYPNNKEYSLEGVLHHAIFDHYVDALFRGEEKVIGLSNVVIGLSRLPEYSKIQAIFQLNT